MTTPEESNNPWTDVGRRLKQSRGPLRLSALFRQQQDRPGVPAFSQSSLRRYEGGAAIRIEHARRLDLLYQADGEVEAAILRASGRFGDRAVLAVPSDAIQRTSLTWPSDYDGDVWVRLHGADTEVQRLWLSWGPWRVVVDAYLDRHPALVTGHTSGPSDPSGPTPLVISASVEFEVEHGTGSPPPGSDRVDLHHRWHAVDA